MNKSPDKLMHVYRFPFTIKMGICDIKKMALTCGGMYPSCLTQSGLLSNLKA